MKSPKRALGPGLGARIRELRKKREVTLNQLAAKCNVTVSGLSQIERGVIANPSMTTLQAIAKVLNVDVSYLLTGEGTVMPDLRAESIRAATLLDSLTAKQRAEIIKRIEEVRAENEEILRNLSKHNGQ